MRNAWKAAHRAHRKGLRGRELFFAIVEATGETWEGPFTAWQACRMQSLLQENDREPDSLARIVLNGWGSRSGWRAPDPGPGSYFQPNARYAAWHRHSLAAHRLRESLIARGLVELDAGGWVQSVPARAKAVAESAPC